MLQNPTEFFQRLLELLEQGQMEQFAGHGSFVASSKGRRASSKGGILGVDSGEERWETANYPPTITDCEAWADCHKDHRPQELRSGSL